MLIIVIIKILEEMLKEQYKLKKTKKKKKMQTAVLNEILEEQTHNLNKVNNKKLFEFKKKQELRTLKKFILKNLKIQFKLDIIKSIDRNLILHLILIIKINC